MKKVKDYLIFTVQLLFALSLMLGCVVLVGLLAKVIWKLFLTGWHVW